MKELRFMSKEQEAFFFAALSKAAKTDAYHAAFFYTIGLSSSARRNIASLFDFKQDVIRPEALRQGWQTSGSMRATLLAFNLWNGYVEQGQEELSTPEHLFSCDLAPYFFEAIKLRYPEYSIELLDPYRGKQETMRSEGRKCKERS